jgi:hypothetical protein
MGWCQCGRCIPVETPRGLVCAQSRQPTKTNLADVIVRNGERINVVTGVVLEQGLGTDVTDRHVLGREGLKAHDFDHFKRGCVSKSAALKSNPTTAQRKPRRRGFRSKLPDINIASSEIPVDQVSWVAASDGLLARTLVNLLKTAPRDPETLKSWSDMTLQQEAKLVAHVKRSLEVADEEYKSSPEALCVLVHTVAQALAAPDTSTQLADPEFVSNRLLQLGFGRGLTKRSQDHLDSHATAIFLKP